MIQLFLILCFVSVYVHDSMGPSAPRPELSPPLAILWSLASFAALILTTHLAIKRLGRRVDRTGSWAAVRRAEDIVRRARLLAVALHIFNVWYIGWVDAIRHYTTDLVLLDELIILAPVLLAWSLGWWSLEPIERRIREATLVRDLDSGKPLYPIVTRWQFVLSNLRYHVLLILIPLCMLLAWSETVETLAPRLLGTVNDPDTGARVLNPDRRTLADIIQLAGVAVVFFLMPLGLRIVWDTIPLGPGPLRDSLLALCTRAKVRITNLLVWRTHGLMLNGAAVGLFWPLRYILLTDALLDHLAPPQVEAVAAHEVGHIHHHHLPWLGAAMVTTVIGAGLALGALALALAGPDAAASNSVGSLLALVSLAGALAVMGFVSRRFEWQADAYAAIATSRLTTPEGLTLPSPTVTPEAVTAMQTALTTVAHSSGLPLRKFTWRHGSIHTRQCRLAALVGRPIHRLPIDRQIRWLKLTIAAAALAVTLAALGIYSLTALLHHLNQPSPTSTPTLTP